MKMRVFCCLALACTMTAPAALVQADTTTDLILTADGDSRWYDLFSAAWVELGQPWNGSSAEDGFFAIESEAGFGGGMFDSNTFDPTTFNPSVYDEIGSGADAFPNEPVFSIGNYSVTYDDSGITGIGTEVANITGFSLNFSNDIVIDILGAESDTWTTSSATGTVTLVNGLLSEINGNTDISTTYDLSFLGAGIVDYEGTFSVNANNWELYVDGPPAGNPARALRMVWDAQGSLTAVPEPGAAAVLMLTACSMMLGWRRRHQ